LNPAYHQWLEEFPALQDSVLQASIANNAKLIAMENLYMYGDTQGKPMTEDMPMNAHTRKGKLRAQMHQQLMDAHNAGKVQVVTGRASDFFGPKVLDSAMGERVFGFAVDGKSPQLLGDVNALHTQSYMKDIGKGLVLLAQTDDAYGQAWHIPNPRTVTQKDFVDLIGKEIEKDIGISVMPKILVRIIGLFVKPLGEMVEMMYEFEDNFVVDFSKFERKFGNIATPLEEAIQETVTWYRQHS
jgi:nucleoside-diphosphate-sugar epimerase